MFVEVGYTVRIGQERVWSSVATTHCASVEDGKAKGREFARHWLQQASEDGVNLIIDYIDVSTEG